MQWVDSVCGGGGVDWRDGGEEEFDKSQSEEGESGLDTGQMSQEICGRKKGCKTPPAKVTQRQQEKKGFHALIYRSLKLQTRVWHEEFVTVYVDC